MLTYITVIHVLCFYQRQNNLKIGNMTYACMECARLQCTQRPEQFDQHNQSETVTQHAVVLTRQSDKRRSVVHSHKPALTECHCTPTHGKWVVSCHAHAVLAQSLQVRLVNRYCNFMKEIWKPLQISGYSGCVTMGSQWCYVLYQCVLWYLDMYVHKVDSRTLQFDPLLVDCVLG